MAMRLPAVAAMLLVCGVAHAAESCADYGIGQATHWAADTVFYQVFVRSFADSDGDGNGDFPGLTARLDYLNDGDACSTGDLGVTGIWLMPMNESPSYHGYDTADYDAVESDYGTMADFDAFIAAAHARGIKVIMDLVVNHSSTAHPWFMSAISSRDSPYHDWFVWRDEDPGWTQPWSDDATWHFQEDIGRYYYAMFWGGMPDLNFRNPAVRTEMQQIAKRWLARGVDGFRLDASRYIVEAEEESSAADSAQTHDWWREFSTAIRAEYPAALLLGENWTNVELVAPYYGEEAGEQLDMNFNFDLAGALVHGINSQRAAPIAEVLCRVAGHYPAHALDATFITNHDMERSFTQLEGELPRAHLAASLLFTLPGVPFIYYGEELGMPNGPGGVDEDKRTPMRWIPSGGFSKGTPWYDNATHDAATNVLQLSADPASLLSHYRRLIALRQNTPALARGDYRAIDTGRKAVLAFTRSHGGQRVLVVANLSGKASAAIKLDLDADEVNVLHNWPAADLTIRAHDDQVRVGPLPPRAIAVLELGG